MKVQFRTADDKGSTFYQKFDNFEDAFAHYRKAEAFEDCDINLSILVFDGGEIIVDEELICENLQKGEFSKYKK